MKFGKNFEKHEINYFAKLSRNYENENFRSNPTPTQSAVCCTNSHLLKQSFAARQCFFEMKPIYNPQYSILSSLILWKGHSTVLYGETDIFLWWGSVVYITSMKRTVGLGSLLGLYESSPIKKVNQVAPATQAGVYRKGPLYCTLWCDTRAWYLISNERSNNQLKIQQVIPIIPYNYDH